MDSKRFGVRVSHEAFGEENFQYHQQYVGKKAESGDHRHPDERSSVSVRRRPNKFPSTRDVTSGESQRFLLCPPDTRQMALGEGESACAA